MSDSTTQRQTPKPHPKFDRIDIWRTEVSSCRVFCVCSAPAIAPTANTSKESLAATASASASTSASVSGSGESSVTNSTSLTEASVRPSRWDQVRPKLFSSSKKPNLRLELPTGEPRACPVCSSPIDADVSYKSFSKGDCGFVHNSVLPSAEAKNKRLEGGLSAKAKKLREQNPFKAISGVFKGPKTLDPPKAESPLSPSSTNNDKRGSKRKSMQGYDGIPRSGTEMYYLLRPEGRERSRAGKEVDAGSVETLGGLGDDDSVDERGKPRLTLDAKAARLERAQRLLSKTTPRQSR
ncbi:hypothetical protein F5X96DRAFT_164610 [Biscogniauxia mediterranea]|nr:hypothetical protein F5X96DRAFT_164610 [Biscogniauxia mediterranea]